MQILNFVTILALASVGQSITCIGGFKFRSSNHYTTKNYVGPRIGRMYGGLNGVDCVLTWSNECDGNGCKAIDGTYTVTLQGDGDCIIGERKYLDAAGDIWIVGK